MRGWTGRLAMVVVLLAPGIHTAKGETNRQRSCNEKSHLARQSRMRQARTMRAPISLLHIDAEQHHFTGWQTIVA